MKQQSLAAAADQGAGFKQYRRATKRDVFVATMNEIVPWPALCEVIEPHDPKPGNGLPADRAGAHASDVLRATLVQPRRRGL
jgi:IS5 family transposase